MKPGAATILNFAMSAIQVRTKRIYKVTIVGSIVNLVLVAFKFIAGIFGHSSAMIADAVHSLSDFFSDIVVLWFVKLSSRPCDEDHDYGHGKYETFASLIVGVLLAIVGIGLLYNGVAKTIDFFCGEELRSPGYIALVAAILSIVSKEWLYRYTVVEGKRLNSPALIANAWHHRSDALTSVAALAGIGGAMILGPGWAVLDPVAAALVSVFILKAAYDLVKTNLDQLLEKSLDHATKEHIASLILSTPGVTGIHRLFTRRIGSQPAIEAHVRMDGNITLREAHAIASAVEERLRAEYGREIHLIIHMEPSAPADSAAGSPGNRP